MVPASPLRFSPPRSGPMGRPWTSPWLPSEGARDGTRRRPRRRKRAGRCDCVGSATALATHRREAARRPPTARTRWRAASASTRSASPGGHRTYARSAAARAVHGCLAVLPSTVTGTLLRTLCTRARQTSCVAVLPSRTTTYAYTTSCCKGLLCVAATERVYDGVPVTPEAPPPSMDPSTVDCARDC
jgi:hypothetical protein